jgi:hypothetical protein
MPFIFNPGAIPPVDDKEGRKEFKKALLGEIKKLGGKPKLSLGLDKLRRLYSELRAKTRAAKE